MTPPRPTRLPTARPTPWWVLVAALVVLGSWVWRQPDTAPVTATAPGDLILSYGDASAPDTGRPDTGRSETGRDSAVFGEPVSIRSSGPLDVSVTWSGPLPPAARLVTWVDVSSSTGWTRRLGHPATLTLVDDRRSTAVALDLAAAVELAERVERATATSGSRHVAVVAELHDADGAVAHGRLSFDLTATAALPVDPPVSGGAGPARTAPIDRVRIDRPTPAGRPRRHLDMGVVSLDAASARRLLTVGIALAATIAIGTTVVERRRRLRSVADDAFVRYGRTTVWANAVNETSSAVVELPDIDALARVGRDLELPLIAERLGDGVVYRVIDTATVYRFTAPTTDRRTAT